MRWGGKRLNRLCGGRTRCWVTRRRRGRDWSLGRAYCWSAWRCRCERTWLRRVGLRGIPTTVGCLPPTAVVRTCWRDGRSSWCRRHSRWRCCRGGRRNRRNWSGCRDRRNWSGCRLAARVFLRRIPLTIGRLPPARIRGRLWRRRRRWDGRGRLRCRGLCGWVPVAVGCFPPAWTRRLLSHSLQSMPQIPT